VIRVQSLKSTIIVHLAAILLPLVTLFVFESMEDARRTSDVERHFRLHGLALEAKERYSAFGNGAADAVDTSELSVQALAALLDARNQTAELARETRIPELDRVARELGAIAEDLARDRRLPSLLALRERIVAQREPIKRAQADQEARLNESIRQSILDSERERSWMVGVLMLVLAVTVWFVFRMIRYLSRPLSLAVSVADRIAEGRPVAESELDVPFDVGNLVRSLGQMHRSINRYRNEVSEYHGGLEKKISELAESQASLAEAQRLARIGNWHWDTTEPLAHWSDEMYRILGMGPGACAPHIDNFLGLLVPEDRDALRTIVDALRASPGSHSFECRIRIPEGEERILSGKISSQVAEGKVVRLHGTIQDVTERKRAEQEIRRLAHFDSLTGLANRKFFGDRLERTVMRARRNGERIAVMFVDLDRFKRINDTLGHAAGDILLNEVARRLSLCVRAGDYFARDDHESVGANEAAKAKIARLGGDEFTVLLDAIGHPQDAAKVARRILKEISSPFNLEGRELVVTASIGISVFPDDAADAHAMLKNADAAMYRSKELGRNTYQFSAKEMNTEIFEKLTMEGELRRALEHGQFELHYQPKFDLRNGRVVGLEALVRWRHPKRGLLSPVDFIPLAEEIGLIVQIGEWVLDAACRQLTEWRSLGLGDVNVAINLASPSFQQADLVSRVAATLRQFGVRPEQLTVEATESILLRDVADPVSTLMHLRDLGVRISIDDFGTGYSSLSYLRRFPIDQLKIDRSFVKEMTENAHDSAICSAIISLGRGLELEVVAEGVETAQQAHALRLQGCHLMQGYLFGRPVPAEETTPLLQRPPVLPRDVLESLGSRSTLRAAVLPGGKNG
jgi:PAS domain S-box-containing protein